MKYPELLLLPIFMFLDFFLTMACSRLSPRGYGKYFATEHYELNPVWQKAVVRGRWFNWKHTFLTVVISSNLIFLAELVDLPRNCVEGGIGCLLVLFAAVLARHLSNLLIFQHIIRRPDQISGKVEMSHLLTLWISCFHCINFLIPVVLIAIFTRVPFAVGGAFGAFLLLAYHLRWIEKYKTACRRQKAKAAIPNESSKDHSD